MKYQLLKTKWHIKKFGKKKIVARRIEKKKKNIEDGFSKL